MTEPTVAPKAEIRDFGNKSAFQRKITYLRRGGAGFWLRGYSGAASKILCAKTGQGAYLGLILIHTTFEKKSRGLTDVRHKSRTRKFTKIASARVFQPLGASTLAHGWVRTVRTAQNLHNADIQWAERDVEADFVQPKL